MREYRWKSHMLLCIGGFNSDACTRALHRDKQANTNVYKMPCTHQFGLSGMDWPYCPRAVCSWLFMFSRYSSNWISAIMGFILLPLLLPMIFGIQNGQAFIPTCTACPQCKFCTHVMWHVRHGVPRSLSSEPIGEAPGARIELCQAECLVTDKCSSLVLLIVSHC